MRGYLNLPRHWNEEIATESSDPEKKIHSLNETRALGVKAPVQSLIHVMRDDVKYIYSQSAIVNSALGF